MPGKSELADRIAARGWSRSAATSAVDAVLDEITAALAAGERVTLTGFGTFESAPRAARTARNPQTGASIAVAATTVARFHPGATLRSRVASGANVELPPLSGTPVGGLAAVAEALVTTSAPTKAPAKAPAKRSAKASAPAAKSSPSKKAKAAPAKVTKKATTTKVAAAKKASSKKVAPVGKKKAAKSKDTKKKK
ncbi:HU family DNA-binding protein [Cellulomonas sp. McL0617]|uniref:HU family DNA-binding protein n=1 Tax=Cellulomonas sp. McL0617 TaxID=3415675 RepID=UPI003CE742B9